MSRLKELKAEKAKDLGYDNWQHLLWDNGIFDVEKYNNEITLIYAKECSQASLEKAYFNHEIFTRNGHNEEIFELNKESITNPENIVLL